MKKRAQTTIFIIIGLVLVIGVVLVFFLRSSGVERSQDAQFVGDPQFAGQNELQTFVLSCLTEAAFQGFKIIELQSGFIDIPPGAATILVIPPGHEQIITENGMKKVIVDSSGQGNEKVMWLTSDNRFFIPTEESVGRELESYVKESVDRCFEDFSVFEEQGFTVNHEESVVDVEFSKEVLIKLSKKIDLERGDISFNEDEFLVRIPVNLRKALRMGRELALAEHSGSFLEWDIKYLLSLYSFRGDPLLISPAGNGLPPLSFSDPSLDCAQTTWHINEVEEMLQNNFQANFKYITINGYGSNAPEVQTDIQRGVYRGLANDVLSQLYDDVSVDVIFDKRLLQRTNSFFLDIKPRAGDIIKPDVVSATGIDFIPLICNVRYKFKYTMKFPTFMRLTDEASPEVDVLGRRVKRDENFVFDVPIGVHLCGNQNRECTGRPSFARGGTDLDPNIYDGLALPVETMFCNEDNKKSQPMKFVVKDSDGQTLSEIPLAYRCGGAQDDCYIGQSDENGVVEARMPLCVNGLLHSLSNEYSFSFTNITTATGNDVREFEYVLDSFKSLDTNVRLVEMPEFAKNYFMTNGFTQNSCLGNIRFDEGYTVPGNTFDVTIGSTFGPSQILHTGGNISLVPGEYGTTFLVNGPANYRNVPPTNHSGRVINAPNTFVYGSYQDFRFSVTKEELQRSSLMTLFVPVETVNTEIDLRSFPNTIQLNGSIHFRGGADTDCNVTTPDRTIEVDIPKSELVRFFHPRFL